ncbi:hypothetical protein NN561_013771 [Cricetulus griseus]
MAPPGTAQRNGLKTEERKRKSHLPGPRINSCEGRATCYPAGSGQRDPREAPRAHRPSLPGVGRRRAGRRPRPPRRGSAKQHHLGSAPGRPASELPNPEGQNGLSRPPPPSQLTAVHRRAPRPVPLPCQDRPRPPLSPLHPDPAAVTCAAGGGPYTTRMRRGKCGLP